MSNKKSPGMTEPVAPDIIPGDPPRQPQAIPTPPIPETPQVMPPTA